MRLVRVLGFCPETPFAVEITHALVPGGEHGVVVRAEDRPEDITRPRASTTGSGPGHTWLHVGIRRTADPQRNAKVDAETIRKITQRASAANPGDAITANILAAARAGATQAAPPLRVAVQDD